MWRLFGSGPELLEAGRQRRENVRHDPLGGPATMYVLNLFRPFAIYTHDSWKAAGKGVPPLPTGGLPDDQRPLLLEAFLGLCLDWDQASAKFAPLRAQYPDSPALLLAWGQGLDFNFRFEEATAELDRASALTGGHPVVRAALAQCHRRQQDLEEVLRYPDVLIPEKPDLVGALQRRLVVLTERRQYADAVRLAVALEKHCPDPAVRTAVRALGVLSEWMRAHGAAVHGRSPPDAIT